MEFHRTHYKLVDKNGKVLQVGSVPKKFYSIVKNLGISYPLNRTDKLILEEEENV